ncbi:MAG: BON domain-containing protein [Gammaproteobacteria bacterium]|nr:BON domain-containing protein [Gammaproteobacteria bacterium]
MKKIAIVLSAITLCYNLIACSPIILIGATAGAGASIVTDRRSTGKMVEDQAIEMQASDFIYASETFGKKVHVSVTSINAIVLLTGETPKEEYKQAIYDKVMRMRPVKEVINKIEVREVLSMDDRSNDAWITSKVKTRILAKKGLLSRTKVITSNNHVYLMGIVNDKEANEIIGIIKQMDGIGNVTPLYEAYKGKLSRSLAADEHKSRTNNLTTTQASKLEEEKLIKEDDITMKSYVIQPAIILTNDE